MFISINYRIHAYISTMLFHVFLAISRNYIEREKKHGAIQVVKNCKPIMFALTKAACSIYRTVKTIGSHFLTAACIMQPDSRGVHEYLY